MGPRRSILQDQQDGRVAPLQPSFNPIAGCFSSEIGDVLDGPILPGEFGQSFPPSEAPLYVPERNPAGPIAAGDGYPFEDEMYRMLSGPQHVLLFPVAREGLGKSTFVRYFFDCYVPHVTKPTVDSPHKLVDLEDALVLYTNLQTANSAEKIKSTMYASLRRQIRKHHPNISLQANYAMWSRIVDWDDPLHGEAARSYTDESSYRADTVKRQSGLNDDTWVNEAIWYLASKIQPRPHSCLCIVFDNLDQLNEQFQLEIVNICRDWIANLGAPDHPTSAGAGQGALPFKAILPLRPETLQSLMSSITPLRFQARLRIGSVADAQLLTTRKKALLSLVRASDRYVELDATHEDTDAVAFDPLAPQEAARVLGDMMSLDVDPVFDDRSGAAPYPRARAIISGICDGSTRRSLVARWRLLNSLHLLDEMEAKGLSDRLQGTYSLLDAFLVGGLGVCDQDDPLNLTANLLNVIRNSEPPYSTLLGPHALHLLRTATSDCLELFRMLGRIGYRKAEVMECLDAFDKYQLISYAGTVAGIKQFTTSRGIMDAHAAVLENAVYVDNMAIVTPVPPQYRSRMSATVGWNEEHFSARVETSLAFLEFIEAEERELRSYRGTNDRIAGGYKQFEAAFDELRLPSVYARCALEYRKRLEGLQAHRPGIASLLGKRRLEEILNSDVLRVNDSNASHPLVAVDRSI